MRRRAETPATPESTPGPTPEPTPERVPTRDRLLLVAENYPQLKADGLFRDLQAQLEGTENRITVARNRYIGAVKTYNIAVRTFPSNLTAMLFGYKTKPSFTVENEKAIAVPPKVDFGTAAPAANPAAAPSPSSFRLEIVMGVAYTLSLLTRQIFLFRAQFER